MNSPLPNTECLTFGGGECFSLISDLRRESEKLTLLQSQTLLTLLQGHLCDCSLSRPHSPPPPLTHILE